MRIGDDFATISALQLKVRAQARRIEELESGGAYAREVARRKSLQRDYESQVRSLRREVADLGRPDSKMIRGWWDVERQIAERARGTLNNVRPVKIVDKDLSDFSGSQWQLRLV